MVPRSAPDANNLNVPAATALTGNALATWVNLAGVNAGEAVTPVGFSTHVLVDGAVVLSPPAILPIEGGSTYFGLNMGPVTVRGGRHTMGAFHDANELVNETDETDNSWAGQWVWSPSNLATNTLVARQAPPDRDGGWDDLPLGVTRIYNCDGLRFLSDGSFTAVSAWPLCDDLRLRRAHPDTGGRYDGRLPAPRTFVLQPAPGRRAGCGHRQPRTGGLDDVGRRRPERRNQHIHLLRRQGDQRRGRVRGVQRADHGGRSSPHAAPRRPADRQPGQVTVSLAIDPAQGRLCRPG